MCVDVQSRCNSVVDKYTEYDNVIVCLDALLHKSQAYRHLLYNAHIPVSISCCLFMHFYELTLNLNSPTSKGREYRKGGEGEREGKAEEGKRGGEVKEGKEGTPVCIFNFSLE